MQHAGGALRGPRLYHTALVIKYVAHVDNDMNILMNDVIIE